MSPDCVWIPSIRRSQPGLTPPLISGIFAFSFAFEISRDFFFPCAGALLPCPKQYHIAPALAGNLPMHREVLSLILGGGRGTRLYPLTMLRSKPAVPIGGKYRLIDIP